jgi:hypothetical protein
MYLKAKTTVKGLKGIGACKSRLFCSVLVFELLYELLGPCSLLSYGIRMLARALCLVLIIQLEYFDHVDCLF